MKIMETTGFIEAERFCLIHNIDVSFVAALSDYGVIETRRNEHLIMIPDSELPPLERFIRLYAEMDINVEGIHAIAHLLKRMRTMEEEILRLRRRLAIYES